MAKKNINLEQLLSEKDPSTLIKDTSFENGLKLLDELVKLVETGGLALDQAILSYEKGAQLVEHLRTQLNEAEQKLRVINKE